VTPPEVVENLDAEMLKRYSKAIRPLFVSLGVLKDGRLRLDRLIAVSGEELQGRLLELEANEETASKVLDLCRTYAEVKKKYAFSSERGARAARAAEELAPHVEELKKLKETVLSPERTEPVEDLYFKRHIAFGIPSVIGAYREPKFDAYSRGLRVQEALRALLEEAVSGAEEKSRRFAPADLDGWIEVLRHANELFRLNGLENAYVDEVARLLRAGGLRLSQVTDVLRIWQRELTWQVESFYRTFHGPVLNALALYPTDELPERLRRLGPEEEGFFDRAADIVVKDIINTVAGFEEMDRMLNAVIRAVNYHVETGEDARVGAGERLEKGFYVLDEIDAGDAARLAPVLGSKAGNLVRLIKEGIPVPPAAVFPSSRTWESEGYIESREFGSTLHAAVEAIERRSGLGFGGARDPLFLSVRSGSYVSMPGILDTVLYCGMNDATCAALQRSTKDPWLAWDSRRRFIEHYAAVVLGMKSRLLEGVLSGVLKDRGAGEPRELDAGALKEAAKGYLRVLSDNGHHIPDGPYEQLKAAVLAVYRSWWGERAVQFRRAMGVSEHWGTAVTVMRMVYANRRGAGSSVFFTRDPLTLAPGVYGEAKETATGDDLVSGKAPGLPMAGSQGAGSVEETDPELFRLHRKAARRVEEAMGGLPQEVEAAYEKREGVVHVLQTKRMELRRSRGEKFHDACRMESNRIGQGIGVHGGPLTGVATFARSPDEVKGLKEKLNEPVILIRKETSTDDVALMSEVEGVLTAVGGASSHAAILAQKFDLDVVVGCPEMEVARGDEGLYAQIGEYTVMEGSPVSIDGSNGLVYSGICAFMTGDEDG
jgi:pyruvate,orthophosphate dikinase